MRNPLEPRALAELRDVAQGDLAFLRAVCAKFVDAARASSRVVVEAWGTGDLPAVAAAAHKIRGGVASFGATRLAVLAGELEEAAAMGRHDTRSPAPARLVAELGAVEEALAAWIEGLAAPGGGGRP